MKINRFFVLALSVGLFTVNAVAADASTAALYKSKCQSCHGPDGKATTIGKKLGARDFQDPDVAKLSEEDLAKITIDGKNKMPAYKDKLSAAEISEVVKYLKSVKK